MTTLEAALDYAARGWRVVPLCRPTPDGSACLHHKGCGSPGKRPALESLWQERATADGAILRDWWGRYRDANVGVAFGSASGIVAIDVDSEDGAALLARLAGGDGVPVTAEFATGKGYRLLFVIPDGLESDPATVAVKGGDGGEAVRFMSAGTQSVMPPSLHHTGAHYAWVDGRHPDECGLAPMPGWLIEVMARLPERPRAATPAPGMAPAGDPGASPGSDFNARGSWREYLESEDFAYWRTVGEVDHYTRPGKRQGTSVTVGHYRAKDGTPALYVFSGSVPGLDARHCYDLFGAYTRMRHAGDFSAAAKALSVAGFGPQRRASRNGSPAATPPGTPGPTPPAPPLPPGEVLLPPPPEEEEEDDVAGIGDLRRAGASVRWTWEGWIQRGVVTCVAAEGGTGKTRFAADLVRRVAKGLEWPDGRPGVGWAGKAVALWVVADNHHDEMVTLCEAFGIEDAVRVNANRESPYDGVTLEVIEDFAALERRIKKVRPLFVFVDTVGNATDKNMSKQEDAKAFYQPLQIIARRQDCAVVALTHLNAGGKALGRRVMEKVRTCIRLSAERVNDTSCKRRLEVIKSNSVCPPAMGVVMGDAGNVYDLDPPPPPEELLAAGGGGGQQPATAPEPPARVKECADWLTAALAEGPRLVGKLRDEAGAKGFDVKLLYRSMALLGTLEEGPKGRKTWALPTG